MDEPATGVIQGTLDQIGGREITLDDNLYTEIELCDTTQHELRRSFHLCVIRVFVAQY